MSDINSYGEVKSQAKTLHDFHKNALDTSTEYFAILMSVVADERIDFFVRLEYMDLATKALKKAFDK